MNENNMQEVKEWQGWPAHDDGAFFHAVKVIHDGWNIKINV